MTSNRQARNPSYKKTKIVIALGATTLLTGLISSTLSLPDNTGAIPSTWESLAYQPTLTAAASSCGNIFEFNPQPQNYGQIPATLYDDSSDADRVFENADLPRAPMIIPAYGYMSKNALAESSPRFYSLLDSTQETYPTYPQILRFVWEEGNYVIWYDPDADPEQIAAINELVDSTNNVLGLPWLFPDEIPQNRDYAFTAWNYTQSCGTFSTQIFEQFIGLEREEAASRPQAPPEAPLTEDNQLFPINPRR